jgi:hypothetical protein
MASAQAAQPEKKNATKIPRQKASARANSTFVQFESCRPMSRYHQSAALVFSRGDDVGMELPALEAAPCCFVLHPPITAPSKLRISFSIGVRNTKTSTLGVVPTRSVTNLGPWDHQGAPQRGVFSGQIRTGGRAASKGQSPAPEHSGLTAGRCSPAAPPPPS